MVVNLLEETKQELKSILKSPEDISWIGSVDGKYSMTWEEFKDMANFEYDGGFGAQEIATDLIIAFKDNTWLERGEYDGSEWWEYNGFAPIRQPNPKPIKTLGGPGIMWKPLAVLQGDEKI